jgi:hypothetical protein
VSEVQVRSSFLVFFFTEQKLKKRHHETEIRANFAQQGEIEEAALLRT